MRTKILLMLLFLCGLQLLTAADKPAVPAKVDELSVAKLQILALTGEIKQLRREKAQCEFALAAPDEAAYKEQSQTVLKEAFTKAGLKQEEYEIDLRAMEFVKKTAPAAGGK